MYSDNAATYIISYRVFFDGTFVKSNIEPELSRAMCEIESKCYSINMRIRFIHFTVDPKGRLARYSRLWYGEHFYFQRIGRH